MVPVAHNGLKTEAIRTIMLLKSDMSKRGVEPVGGGLAVDNSLGSRFHPHANNLLKQEQHQLAEAIFRGECSIEKKRVVAGCWLSLKPAGRL